MTPQEINEKVARKLGWKDIVRPHGDVLNTTAWSPTTENRQSLPNYCGSIEAAWEIVEHMQKKRYIVSVHTEKQGYHCEVNLFNPDPKKDIWVHLFSDTAPMAICKVFLKLEEK